MQILTAEELQHYQHQRVHLTTIAAKLLKAPELVQDQLVRSVRALHRVSHNETYYGRFDTCRLCKANCRALRDTGWEVKNETTSS